MTDPLYAPPFALSHHRFDERHKCFRLGGSYVCARCLATYPVLFAALALQLHRPFAPTALPYDWALLYVLPVPALLDWVVGQVTAWRGSNALRFLSGLLLGGSLGRASYLYIRHPKDPRVFAYGLALVGVAGVAWGLRQVLRKRPDDKDLPGAVEPQTTDEILGGRGGKSG